MIGHVYCSVYYQAAICYIVQISYIIDKSYIVVRILRIIGRRCQVNYRGLGIY